jgi:signal transduction histidine kinase
MRRTRLDLGEAISEGLDSFAPLLETSQAKLELDLEPDVWVDANGHALTRIVVNLLDNAIKYGPAGQTLRVGVNRIDGVARLSVADEGPGVPPADRDRIWKAYRRLDRDVRAQVPGSGIGLSVVRDLVSLQGGRVWTDEADGGGARFMVEFPLVEEPAGADAVAQEVAS